MLNEITFIFLFLRVNDVGSVSFCLSERGKMWSEDGGELLTKEQNLAGLNDEFIDM
ncbi:hypothetical protein PLUTE_a0469 [Pseudoalteromonas luteoviolacea DSM 6061]|nr:hypothetical protein [Pseudoalteromonas luteoviolacea DSM 6061]